MTLLPAKLKRAGYSTAIVGKWHLGARSMRNIPLHRGFDYHFGFLGGGEHHFTQQSYECENLVDLWEGSQAGVGPAYGQNGSYSCELYSRKITEHIEAHNPSVPLFIYMAFHDVHAPLECPAAYFDPKTAGTPRQNVQGMVRCVSLATGNITDAIKAKGLWANSLFIWSADKCAFTHPCVSRRGLKC